MSKRTTAKVCFFCGKHIRGKHEKHHVKPKRYFRRGSNHRRGNIVKVHSECHCRLHHEVENCRWKWWQFKGALEPLNRGEGGFAGG